MPPSTTTHQYWCLNLPAQIPLESLLAAGVPDAIAADAALLDALTVARRRLAEVLAMAPTQRELGRFLDRRPDTDRLPIGDSAQEAAIRDELLLRGEKRLAEAVASGMPLNRDEKRARRLLARLRKLAALFEKG